MGIFFNAGEKKKRAGVYQRYVNTGIAQTAGAVNGVVGATYKGNWGPLGEVTVLESDRDIADKLGTGGEAGTVNILNEVFSGEAVKVLAVRLGTGGTKGTVVLTDTTSNTPIDAVTISMKYEGDRAFKYSVREALGSETVHEFVLFEENVIKEKFSFDVSDNEVDTLITAINASSDYMTATKVSSYSGTGKLALSASQDITVGTNPTVTTTDYSNAFVKLEPHRWNTICTDTVEVEIHQLLSAFIGRVYQEGKMSFAVVGEPVSVSYATRLSHAKAFNDYNVIYVGGGWEDSMGVKIDGAKAVARIAGMVAAIPSNQSMTHKSVAGAVKPLELLTNSGYEQAVDSGMITFSVSSNDIVWIDNGITTLVSPEGEDDEGFKKIKRTKIRFELMNRINDTVEPLIGKLPNKSDGHANIIQVGQGILNDMVAEGKLLGGAYIELDKTNPPVGDSAWFNIVADDVDTMEKIYFVYKLRFTPNQA